MMIHKAKGYCGKLPNLVAEFVVISLALGLTETHSILYQKPCSKAIVVAENAYISNLPKLFWVC